MIYKHRNAAASTCMALLFMFIWLPLYADNSYRETTSLKVVELIDNSTEDRSYSVGDQFYNIVAQDSHETGSYTNLQSYRYLGIIGESLIVEHNSSTEVNGNRKKSTSDKEVRTYHIPITSERKALVIVNCTPPVAFLTDTLDRDDSLDNIGTVSRLVVITVADEYGTIKVSVVDPKKEKEA